MVSVLMYKMKTSIIIICVISVISGYGQDEEIGPLGDRQPYNPQTVNTIIKTNPFSVLWGPIPFTAEYRAIMELTSSKNQSDQFGISYLGKSPVIKLFEDSIDDLKLLIIRGLRFQASHKFYIMDYAPHGFYLSPHLSYSSAKFSTKFANSRDIYIRATHFNVNLLAGYQFLPDFWALDIFAGLGYKKNTWIEHDQQNTINIDTGDFGELYNSSVKLTLGFNVGIVF